MASPSIPTIDNLGMSMTDMSISDSVGSLDLEMLLDTLEDSVGSGITTATHRRHLALRQSSNDDSLNPRSRGSSLNNISFDLNPVENDALEYFDELFASSTGGSGTSEQMSSTMPPPPQPQKQQQQQKQLPQLQHHHHHHQQQLQQPVLPDLSASQPKSKKRPTLTSTQFSAPRAPPRTKVTDTTNMLVGQDAADKVFAQEMPSSAAEYDSIPGVTVAFQNTFFDRYWRNKRHNVQCFPSDGEYGDYCNWLMAPKETKGDLSVPLPVCVQVDRTNAASHSYDQVQCISRIIPLSDRRATCTPGSTLPTDFIGLSSFESDGGYSVGARSTVSPNVYEIAPKLWKYQGELPKKRRQGMDYRLCLEVLILGRPTAATTTGITSGKSPLICLAWCASPAFELGSTRTLMRLKVKYKESMRGSGSVSARNPPTKRVATKSTEPSAGGAEEAAQEQQVDKRQKQDSTSLENDVSL